MLSKGSVSVSQWDKLIDEILRGDAALRFDDLCKALEQIGYTARQPKGGSSHYTFRKAGCMPVTIPKHYPINKAYIAMVAEIVREYLTSEEENSDD